MGYQLRREVRDALPPGVLTSAERVLVLEIADVAGDDTREGWPGAEVLAEMTDLSEDSISKLLNRVAKKWVELRIAIGEDSKGRPVYARNGHRTIFRFPPLRRWNDGPTPRSDECPTLGLEGGTASERPSYLPTGKWNDRSVKVGPSSGPSPQGSPHDEPQISPQRPATVVRHLADYGLTEDERDPFIRWIEKAKNVHTPDGWIISAARNGTLGDRVTEWRDASALRRVPDSRPPAEGRADAAPCVQHGTPSGQRCDSCVAARMYAEMGGKHPGYLPPALQAAWEAVAAERDTLASREDR